MKQVDHVIPKRYAFFKQPRAPEVKLRFSHWDGETSPVTKRFMRMHSKLGIHCVMAGLCGDYASSTNLAAAR